MGEAQRYILLFFGAAIVYNVLLIRFLALCSFFGVSNSMETSVGMSIAVLFVMAVATLASWLLWTYVLTPLGVGEFLYIPAFILVIAALVQFEEMFIRKVSPPLYKAMGIFLPLITTNCAVLAIAVETVRPGFLKVNIPYGFTLPESLTFTLGAALGYGVAILLFAAIRDRIKVAPIAKSLEGAPIAFITAGLMSLAFIGFAGMFGL
ncbi:MAG: electron transport complex subunit RsxA [Actinobacteria bacterium]|nr:MAG: electron transport complex subunit RsxA [Actinomycetota bacterium]